MISGTPHPDRHLLPVENGVCRVSAIAVWITGLYAVVGGIFTLIGWAIPFPRFTDWADLGISMFPNAAACSIFAGAALILIFLGGGRRMSAKVGRVFALSTGIVGGLTLFEHVTGLDLGIDEILFEGTWGQTAAAAPNRMGVPASSSFLVLGFAMAMTAGTRRCRCVASGLAVIPLGIASLSIVGYWFGADQLFGVARYTGISWQTATIIAALGIGLMASLRECGFMAILMRRDAAGIVSRRLILPILVIPLLLGWVRVMGRDLGWFDDDFGTAIRTLLEIALFLGFLWWSAKHIARHEAAAAEAVEALRVSEDRFARFMRSLPGLAWIKDLEGRYVYANDSALRAFQQNAGEVYGFTDRDILPAETAREFMVNDRLALADPGGRQFVETLRSEDGTLHSSIVSKFPIPGRDGSPVGVGGIAIDITDRLRAEEELKEAHRRKDEFLATLAHELRNPLSPIRFSVEICRHQSDPEAGARALDLIDRQVAQMSRLLEDLLDVSRISYQKLDLRPEVVDLSAILARAVEVTQPLRDEVRQSIHLDLPPGPALVYGDPVRLEQIFGNLLHNAAKYAGRDTRVWLGVKEDDDGLVISVRDDGIGIPAHRLADVFEMFSQVKTPSVGLQGGLGIGLALVRGLVELHGGRVEGRSEGPGQGSEFLIHLPSHQPTLTLTPSPRSPQEDGAAAARGDGRRLLIADDMKDNADSLCTYFHAIDWEVRAVYDGESALAAAASFRPDAILLDIGMPGLGGHEVCRRIRDEPWGREALIIAITGWGREADRRLTEEAGFDHHLVKPVDARELVALLSTFRRDEPSHQRRGLLQ